MEHVGKFLRTVREKAGLTQEQVGERLGKRQAEVSAIERRPNTRLSTLDNFVRATGGTLRIEAQFPDQAA